MEQESKISGVMLGLAVGNIVGDATVEWATFLPHKIPV